MNTKIIHSVILLLLLSLTVHEIHASVIHDVETCDTCIHVQSNGNALEVSNSQYLLLDTAFHLKIKTPQQQFTPSLPHTADFIRGPPLFS